MIKTIKNFPNYTISSCGKIINTTTMYEKVHTIGQVGYAVVDLWHKGTNKKLYIHRVLAEAFIPNPENKRTVNHIDGDKLNNTLSNLEWATDSENIRHAYATGLNVSERDVKDHHLKEIYARVIKGEYLTNITKDYTFELSAVSVRMREYVTKQGIEEEYDIALRKQKLIRNKDTGITRRDTIILQQLDKDTEEVVATYSSIVEAANALNVKSSGPISNVLIGRHNTAYGFKWRKQ